MRQVKIEIILTEDDPQLAAILSALTGATTGTMASAPALSGAGAAKPAAKPAKPAKAEVEKVEEVEEVENVEEDLMDEPEVKSKFTMDDCRTEAQRLIGAGKSAKLKEILKALGAAKVVDVPKESYDEFIKKCKAIK